MVFVRANTGRAFRATRKEAAAGEQAPVHMSAQKKLHLAELQATLARIGTTKPVPSPSPRKRTTAIPLGIPEIDACLATHGLARGAVHEVRPVSTQDRMSGIAFAAALLARIMAENEGPAVLVTSEASLRDFGAPYGPGLFQFGIDPTRLVFIDTRSDLDALWAIEETLRAHAGLAGVAAFLGRSVTAIGRNATSTKGTHLADLTLSRRLSLAAAESATPLILEVPPSRGEASASFSSAAQTRWSIAPASEPGLRFGAARDALFRRTRWRANLEKSRNGRSGEWMIEWDHAAYCFHMAAELAGDALAERQHAKGGSRSEALVRFEARASQ